MHPIHNQTTGENRTLAADPELKDLLDKAGTAWLDSTLAVRDKGRRSASASRPTGDWIYQSGWTEKTDRSGRSTENSTLEQFLNDLHEEVRTSNRTAIGYITYEACLEFLHLPELPNEFSLPAVRFYLYDSVDWTNDSLHTLASPPCEIGSRAKRLVCTVTKERYEQDILAIKHHLREGDIYQANYTCRWETTSAEPAWVVYRRLRDLNPSPYNAYLNFGEYQILSSSPERMLHWTGNRVRTSPIKGTIARGATDLEERQNLHRLLASEKDRAEHLMIVDLERNDLGRIARTGTVRVDQFCQPEVYANLIHLVSEISATLAENVSLGTVMKALLPGGSITGAPKRRAVEILRQLEAVPRSVYTGCIGYISPDTIEFNIAIRTMVHQNGVYHAYAGGGIVADSEPVAEYEEMLLKAERMMHALGIMNMHDMK